MSAPIEITPQQAEQDAASGKGVLVDVREPWEWEGGHASGATLMSLYDLPSRHQELPRGKSVLCICASGNRSRTAAEYLQSLGYEARSVSGGTAAWSMHRLPLDVPGRTR